MHISRIAAAAALFAAISACPASAQPEPRDIPGHLTYMPDGSHAYAVTCDGPFDDMQVCVKRAGEICRETGFQVLSSSSRSPDLPDPIAQFKRSMTIRCRTPDGLYPQDRFAPPQ